MRPTDCKPIERDVEDEVDKKSGKPTRTVTIVRKCQLREDVKRLLRSSDVLRRDDLDPDWVRIRKGSLDLLLDRFILRFVK